MLYLYQVRETKGHEMNTFKNRNYTKRDYECTNIVCCESETAPNDNWIECDKSELTKLSRLHREGETIYYGYM